MELYEYVKRRYDLPMELYPFQQKSVNELSTLPTSALYYDQGCVDAETEFLTPRDGNALMNTKKENLFYKQTQMDQLNLLSQMST